MACPARRRPAERRARPGTASRGEGRLLTEVFEVERCLRELSPRVLGALTRRRGDFQACEDAVQEALVAAATSWAAEGIPANPFGWLYAVASRRLVDAIRSDVARRQREHAYAATPVTALLSGAAEDAETGSEDDSLDLLLLCCHPSLSAANQVALTLRAVGGLTTRQIAHAFFTAEKTTAQRISRAKQTIQQAGGRFEPDLAGTDPTRLAAALRVLYLIFNEGYTSTVSADLTAPSLSTEAIRLTRMAAGRRPEGPEVLGLLALMLLTEARRPTRTDAAGDLVPLSDQDRARWDRALIAEGDKLVTRALSRGAVGEYQLQAAIAAVHSEAPTTEQTDWPQVLALYDLLHRTAPSPMVSLSRAVAVAEVHGPAAALQLLDELETDPRLAHHHRFLATRATLRERLGDRTGAQQDFEQAAAGTDNARERRHLEHQASQVDG